MRFKLTKTAKILLSLIVIVIIGAGIFAGLKTGIIKNDTKEKINELTEAKVDESGNVLTLKKETESTINLSLDEWIG